MLSHRIVPGRLLILGACVLLPAVVEALTLRIVDARSGAPIAGAEVSILGQSGVSRSDAQGRVTWNPPPPLPFEVLVVLPGGNVLRPVPVEQVAPDGDTVVSVVPLVEEELTVSAPAAPGIETTPGSGVTLLSGREIRTRAPANLMQVLENVPGVSQVSEGQAAVPAVRGLARGRTLILIDGARVSSERRVGPSATFLDPFVLESVEVARGPGSVAYGSDAFGGVILARTRRVAPNAGWGARFIGTLGAGIPEARGGLEVSKGVAGGGVLAEMHYRQAEDYRSPRGDVFNSGWEDYGFLVRGEHVLGPGVVTAGWQSDFGRDVERPRNNSGTVRFYYPEESSHRFTAAYDIYGLGGFRRVGVNAFLGANRVVTDQDRFATATRPRGIERADVSANDYHARAFAERAFGGRTLVEAGLDVNGRYDLEALDSILNYAADGSLASEFVNVSVENAHRTDVGTYVMVESRVAPRLSLSAGARGDRVTTENSGGYFGDRSTSEGAFSGLAAASVDLAPGWVATVQVSRGFRDPVLSDRYYRGPTGRGFITGNPALEPETSLQFDASLRYTSQRLRGAIFFYHYRITDLVERYQTAPDFFFFRNRGEARLRGVEIEAAAGLPWQLTLEVSGQLARGRAVDDDVYLDDVGTDSLVVQLRRALGQRGFVSLRGAAYGRDTRPGPTEIVTPGYALVDGTFGWRLSEPVELRVHGRNLLDQPHLASPDPRAVLAPGVSGSVTAVVSF